MNKKSLWILILIVVVLIALVATFSNKKEEGPIKIGFVGSFSGDYTIWGMEAQNSFRLAVEEINATGGVDGREVVVVYEDGECTSSKAVSAARKLIDVDQVDVLVSYCSQEALSIAPVAEENQILHFVPAATVPELTNIGTYTFRTGPSDGKAAQTLAEIVLEDHTKLAILTENNDYTKSLRGTFVETFTSGGGEIVFDEAYDSGETDFRTFITKMKVDKPTAVLVNTNQSVAAGLVVKQMSELGLDADSYGVYYGSDPEFHNVAGDASEGFTYLNFTIDTTGQQMQEFMTRYSERFGEEVPHPQFGALLYNAPYILQQAIASVGTDSDALVQYLNELEKFDGVFGLVEFDGSGEVAGSIFKRYVIQEGAPVLAE